jgi:hypothetical protein
VETNTSGQPLGSVYNQSAQTEPLHQYADTAQPAQQTVPTYTQQLPTTYPTSPLPVASNATSQALSVGVLGLIVVGTGTLGANLHRVQDGDMSMSEAVTNSLAKGAAGGVAAAGATAASTSFTTGGALGLAVTVAVGTGISYLLNK